MVSGAQLWLRPDLGGILGARDDRYGASDSDVFQAMYPTGSGRHLDLALFVVDRHDVANLHDDQSASGGLEGDPAHRAPRAIISLM